MKVAFERLLGGACYDNRDLVQHPEQVEVWERALDGSPVDWPALFAEHRSVVDMTAALFFGELADAFPKALVVLSVRDADEWWRSFDGTVVDVLRNPKDDPLERALAPVREFTVRMLETRFTPEWTDETSAKRAYARHNNAVRAAIPSPRLVEWRPGDGWDAICAALGVPVPSEQFPHVNTTADFREMAGRDPAR